MSRILKEVTQPFTKSDKLKMRKIFKQGLGLARNTSEKVLARTIGVPINLLYNYLSQDYNNYVNSENVRILAERRRKSQDRRRRLRIERNILISLPINEIQTTFDYPKNKFHIRDYTYQYSATIVPLLEKATDIDVITENATRKCICNY
jgi:hypothetical protein